MLNLYTPGTGFPDLEAKLAFGLSYLAIQTETSSTLSLDNNRYKISVDSQDSTLISQSLETMLRRVLSSEKTYELPGIQPKYQKNYPAAKDGAPLRDSLITILRDDFLSKYKSSVPVLSVEKNFPFCGHSYEPFGGKTGLILVASAHAGQPYARNARGTDFNLRLCEICGYLVMLGVHNFCFRVYLSAPGSMTTSVITPIPVGSMNDKQLRILMATQHELRNEWLSDILPTRVIPLAFLSKFPSIPDAIVQMPVFLHFALFPERRRLGHTSQLAPSKMIKFIRFTAFNIATVNRIIGKNPAIFPLTLLSELLEAEPGPNNLALACSFAREWVAEVSQTARTKGDSAILVYPETVKYLLDEVTMISANVVQSEELKSVARTLRYFVRNKNYGVVDNVRNASTVLELANIVGKALRDAHVRKAREEHIHIPREDEVKKMLELASQNLAEVKTTLTLYALSYEPIESENVEQTESMVAVRSAT
jgi:CRISPR type I-A-associated protein Csa5